MEEYTEIIKMGVAAVVPSLLTYYFSKDKNRADLTGMQINHTKELMELTKERLQDAMKDREAAIAERDKAIAEQGRLSQELISFNMVATELKEELLHCNKKHDESEKTNQRLLDKVTKLELAMSEHLAGAGAGAGNLVQDTKGN